jgi:3D (Asp-Asp-Asp) domain-containing protein
MKKFLVVLLLLIPGVVSAEWIATAYCPCPKCCGKFADGHFASGKKVYVGGVAINWLPFGTKVLIDGKEYTVEDRGAKSIFGSKDNQIKRVDIFFESHQEALEFGRRKVNLIIGRENYTPSTHTPQSPALSGGTK